MDGGKMFQDPHSISTIASAIGTSFAGKKAALGGVIAAMTTENITINHMFVGTVLGLTVAIVSATLWGGDIKNSANQAQAIAIEAKNQSYKNHIKNEALESSLHGHAIEAERRLGGIEADIRVIRAQNNSIITILKSHDKNSGDR